MSNKLSDSNLVLTSFKRVGNVKAKQGDLIEIDRTIYSYWVLYVGRGEVIHVAGEHLPTGVTKAPVVKCRLADLAGQSLVRVNNKYVPAKTRGLVPLKPRQVVSDAMAMVGRKLPYNIIHKNTEHYVTMWKYGSSWSDQSNMALNTMTIFSTSPKLKEDSQIAHEEFARSIQSLLSTPSSPVSSPSTSPS